MKKKLIIYSPGILTIILSLLTVLLYLLNSPFFRISGLLAISGFIFFIGYARWRNQKDKKIFLKRLKEEKEKKNQEKFEEYKSLLNKNIS